MSVLNVRIWPCKSCDIGQELLLVPIESVFLLFQYLLAYRLITTITSMESSLAPHVTRVHLMSYKASAVVGGRATLCVSRAEMDCDDYGEDTPRSCPRAGSR